VAWELNFILFGLELVYRIINERIKAYMIVSLKLFFLWNLNNIDTADNSKSFGKNFFKTADN